MDHVSSSPCTKKSCDFKLPASPIGSEKWQQSDEQLADDHIARLIKKSLSLLDLSPLMASYSGRGSSPHRPDLMVGMMLVEKHAGNCSPSAWHRHQTDHISLCWIGEGICPARGVWYQFRDRVGRYLDLWLSQILKFAQTTGITDATQGVIDGTLIAASASRHRLLNEKQLTTRLQQLLDCVDQAEETALRRPAWMAKTPDGRLLQAGRFQRAKELLQPRLVANAKKCPSERLPIEQVVMSAQRTNVSGFAAPKNVAEQTVTKNCRSVSRLIGASVLHVPYDPLARPAKKGEKCAAVSTRIMSRRTESKWKHLKRKRSRKNVAKSSNAVLLMRKNTEAFDVTLAEDYLEPKSIQHWQSCLITSL